MDDRFNNQYIAVAIVNDCCRLYLLPRTWTTFPEDWITESSAGCFALVQRITSTPLHLCIHRLTLFLSKTNVQRQVKRVSPLLISRRRINGFDRVIKKKITSSNSFSLYNPVTSPVLRISLIIFRNDSSTICVSSNTNEVGWFFTPVSEYTNFRSSLNSDVPYVLDRSTVKILCLHNHEAIFANDDLPDPSGKIKGGGENVEQIAQRISGVVG